MSNILDQYPYLNVNDLNLDYILNAIKKFQNEVTNFVSINAIKYANPIQWNITSQYEKNTIVIDPLTGTAYISVAAVPSGVALTREEYWTVVFDLGSFVTRAARNFTDRYEADTTLTATFSTNAGEWLVWGDTLYRAAVNITAGDQYVVGSNIIHFTMETETQDIRNIIGLLSGLDTTDKSNVVAAINEVIATVTSAVSDLEDAITSEATTRQQADAEINSIIDNVNIVNVLDYGAVGDGVTDDTSAIVEAIATNKIVYFPSGNYYVTSINNFDNTKFIGNGILIYNSHNIPVHSCTTLTLYDSDFSSLNSLINWANNVTKDALILYISGNITTFNNSQFVDANKISIDLYPTGTVSRIVVNGGNLTIHNITWSEVSEVSHLLVMNHAVCKITGTEIVKAKANNFHYWVIDATLDISGLSVEVDENCIFQFFLYAERNSFVNADRFTWSGTTGTCWGAAIIENSYCEAQVYSYSAFNTYFPSSYATTPNINSRDYILSALAVGGKIGSIPDYGWKPFYGESGYDLAGKTLMEADDIPDQYTTLTLYARDVVCNGGVLYVQVRRMFENSWDTSIGDYIGRDQQLPINAIQKTVTGGTVTIDNVDYPVDNAKVSVNSETFELEDFSVSAISFGTGNNPIEVQLTFIQYAGLSRPMYIGYVLDGAGTKHYIIGLCKAGRIASIRLLASQAITSGTGNIILNY